MKPNTTPLSNPVGLEKKYFLCFLSFCVGHALLAYTSLPWMVKLWTGVILLGGPFLALCAAGPKEQRAGNAPALTQWPGPIPSWAWGGVALAGISIRSWMALHSGWFVPDEGMFGDFSVELSRHWTWHFFFSSGQTPPLFNWAFAFYLKLFGTSLPVMRAFPFGLFLLSLPLAALACRTFWPPRFSLMAFAFFCLGYWPQLSFQWLMPMPAALLPQILVFWALGILFRNEKPSLPPFFFLGTAIGIGFWAAVPFPLVLLALAPPVYSRWRALGGDFKYLAAFLLPLAALCGSFALVSFWQGNGAHIRWLLQNETAANGFGRLRSLLSNVTTLFWEGHPVSSLGPVWGGLLNPLESAVFWIGVSEMVRRWREPFCRWMVFASFLFFIPGLLTSGFETFHNMLFLPLIPVLCALGLKPLALGFPARFRWAFLGLFLAFSAFLNAFHLRLAIGLDSPGTSERAFGILDQCRRTWGPGFIFQDLNTDTEDSTLSLGTDSFNAALNPQIKPDPVKWVAVIQNSNYRYFLAPRFPGAQWFDLGPDGFWNQGDLALMVAPLKDSNGKTVQDWLSFNSCMHQVTDSFLFDPRPDHLRSNLSQLLGMEAQTRQDLFLKSVFYEKIVFYARNATLPRSLLPWVEKAVEKGYPAPHLLTAQGLLELSLGHKEKAQKILREAAGSPGQSTSAAEILKAIPPPQMK